jgi:hypothetical protein
MAREKKIEGPVTLFAAIETEQHQALREIAFKERRSSHHIAKRPAKGGSRRLASGRR